MKITFIAINVIFFIYCLFATSCNCNEGDKNYFIPPFLNNINQQITLKVENNPSVFVDSFGNITTFLPNTTVNIFPNSKNEFFSVQRKDSYSGIEYSIYWQSSFVPFIDTKDPNSIFRPLSDNEEIYVYNCVFVRSNNLSCFLKTARPVTKTKMYVVVKVENGKVVNEQTIFEDAKKDIGQIDTYGYYLSTLKAKVKAKGDYTFDIIANADSSDAESNYTDNNYVTKMSIK